MDKKKVISELVDLGIYSLDFIPKEKINDYSEDKIMQKDGANYYINDHGVDDADMALKLKQTRDIRTIKNILVFGLTVSIIAGLIYAIAIHPGHNGRC